MLTNVSSSEHSIGMPELTPSSDSPAVAAFNGRWTQWFNDGMRGLPMRLCIAVLLYVIAVMGRDALHTVLIATEANVEAFRMWPIDTAAALCSPPRRGLAP